MSEVSIQMQSPAFPLVLQGPETASQVVLSANLKVVWSDDSSIDTIVSASGGVLTPAVLVTTSTTTFDRTLSAYVVITVKASSVLSFVKEKDLGSVAGEWGGLGRVGMHKIEPWKIGTGGDGGGGIASFNFVTKTANYTITTADEGIAVDASGGGVTISLPTAVGAAQAYCVKRMDTTYANAVSIVPVVGGQTIDTAAGQLLVVQGHALTFGSDNSNWLIASSHYPNPGTTLGDLVVIDANGVPQRLAVGANTKVLTADTGKPLGEDWE